MKPGSGNIQEQLVLDNKGFASVSSETISKIIIGSFYDIVKHAFPSLIGTQTNWWYGWLILKEHIFVFYQPALLEIAAEKKWF